MKLTGETITDEQIRPLLSDLHWNIQDIARVALSEENPRQASCKWPSARMKSRARCAEILNTYNKGK